MHLKSIYTIKTYKIQCTIIISSMLGLNFKVLKVKINTLWTTGKLNDLLQFSQQNKEI